MASWSGAWYLFTYLFAFLTCTRRGGGSLVGPRAPLRLSGIFVDQEREGEEIRVHIRRAGHSSAHDPSDMQSAMRWTRPSLLIHPTESPGRRLVPREER